MKVNEAVALYIQLRDKKAQMKKDYEESVAPVQEAMDKIEAKLLEAMDYAGTDSLQCRGVGTAYVSLRTSASVADRETFIRHVKEHDDWGLLEVRAAKSGVEEYRAQHEGQLPPGVSVREERTVNVRRS